MKCFYSVEPPSNRTGRDDRHPALRDARVAGGKLRRLSLVGSELLRKRAFNLVDADVRCTKQQQQAKPAHRDYNELGIQNNVRQLICGGATKSKAAQDNPGRPMCSRWDIRDSEDELETPITSLVQEP
jgi:hypothetical protein